MASDERAAVLSRDTSAKAERLQIDAWRRMSTVDKARSIAGASRSVRALALAGLRARHPGAGERELIARLAELTLGRSLALKVYPEPEQFASSRGSD